MFEKSMRGTRCAVVPFDLVDGASETLADRSKGSTDSDKNRRSISALKRDDSGRIEARREVQSG